VSLGKGKKKVKSDWDRRDPEKMKPINRRRATMMTQVDLRYPLKSGMEEKDPVAGRIAERDFPQVFKLLPLRPPPPGGKAPGTPCSAGALPGAPLRTAPQEYSLGDYLKSGSTLNNRVLCPNNPDHL